MSNKHVSLLRAIFHDPVSNNIHWREVESLLHHLGAAVTPTHGASFRVALNGCEDTLHHPHQSNVCDRTVIKRLREFLARAGVTPSSHGGAG